MSVVKQSGNRSDSWVVVAWLTGLGLAVAVGFFAWLPMFAAGTTGWMSVVMAIAVLVAGLITYANQASEASKAHDPRVARHHVMAANNWLFRGVLIALLVMVAGWVAVMLVGTVETPIHGGLAFFTGLLGTISLGILMSFVLSRSQRSIGWGAILIVGSSLLPASLAGAISYQIGGIIGLTF